MRNASVVCLVALLSLGCNWANAQEKPAQVKAIAADKTTAEDLKKLDAHLTEATIKGDVDVLARHTADDYVLIDPTGKVWSKKHNLEAIKSKTITFESITDSNVKVHINGETGVVFGLAAIKGKTKTHEIDGEYRWTRVYAQTDGRWQCVLEQLTHVHHVEKK